MGPTKNQKINKRVGGTIIWNWRVHFTYAYTTIFEKLAKRNRPDVFIIHAVQVFDTLKTDFTRYSVFIIDFEQVDVCLDSFLSASFKVGAHSTIVKFSPNT